VYRNRAEAGRQLAALCRRYEGTHPVVLGLPRGGVVVADEVARALAAPLDIVVVRKLGAPMQQELAIGAVYDTHQGAQTLLDDWLVARLDVPEEYIQREVQEQVQEIRRREEIYRGDTEPEPLEGRVVIVVDDGIATGATTRAALRAVRARRPGLLVLAAPVAARASLDMLRPEADEIVCPAAPDRFHAVGEFYIDFDQTSDSEVIEILTRARGRMAERVSHAGQEDPP
jgi:putative phosphoribosyl transferase